MQGTQQQQVQQVQQPQQIQQQQRVQQGQQNQSISRKEQNEQISNAIADRLKVILDPVSLFKEKYILESCTSDYILVVDRILNEQSIQQLFMAHHQKNEFYKYQLLDQAMMKIPDLVECSTQNFQGIQFNQYKLKIEKKRTCIEVRFDNSSKTEAYNTVQQLIQSQTANTEQYVIQDRNEQTKFYVFCPSEQETITLFSTLYKQKLPNGKTLQGSIQNTDLFARYIWEYLKQTSESRNNHMKNQYINSLIKQFQVYFAHQQKQQFTQSQYQGDYIQQQRKYQRNYIGNMINQNMGPNNGIGNHPNNGPGKQGPYRNHNNNHNNNNHYRHNNSYPQHNNNHNNHRNGQQIPQQHAFIPDESSFPSLSGTNQNTNAAQNYNFGQQQLSNLQFQGQQQPQSNQGQRQQQPQQQQQQQQQKVQTVNQ